MSEFIVRVNDKTKNITIVNDEMVKVGKKNFNYDLSEINCNTYLLKLGNIFYEITSTKLNGEKYSIQLKGNHFETIVRTRLQEKAVKLIEEARASSQQQMEVKAPMPGMILKIKKKSGDEIQKGESIMILEAMKMENDLRAPASGVLKNIDVLEGAAVEKGAILFSIE